MCIPCVLTKPTGDRPETRTGDLYMLMWVDKHDEAYDWARRHDCAIHPVTGAIQVIDISYIKPASEPVVVDKPKLFAAYTAEQILALGVPPVFIEQVMALVDTVGLNQLESVMPAEAWEPLHWLAEGLDYREVLEEFNEHRNEPVDTNDFIEAIERSKRRFHVVENEQELLQMLNAPLEKMACVPAPEPAKTGGVSGKWSGTCIRWCRHGKNSCCDASCSLVIPTSGR